MGRRSALPALLADAGGDPVHEESEDSGFLYYTRYFRAGDGRFPVARAPVNSHLGSFSLLTLPADAGVWSVTVYAASGDRPLKRLRDVASWDGAGARLPAARPLARRRADDGRHADGRRRRPLPALHRDGRGGQPRRRLGLHEPVARPRDLARPRHAALLRGVRCRARRSGRARRAPRRGDGARAQPGTAQRRPSTAPAWRNPRSARRRAARTGARRHRRPRSRGAPAGHVPRRTLPRRPEIASCLALPQEVFARPGLAQRVLEDRRRADRDPAGPRPRAGPEARGLADTLSPRARRAARAPGPAGALGRLPPPR